MRSLCIGGAIALIAVVAGVAFVGPVQQAAAAEPGPAAAQFTQVFGEWQKVLGELRELKDEYKSANGARKSEIEARYDELIKQGEAMLPKMIEAAKNAYVESPGANPDVAEFLSAMVPSELYTDNYEDVLPLAEELAKAEPENPAMYAYAGMAALALMQLDKAEEYLDQATEKKALGALAALGPHQMAQLTQNYKQLLAYYKKEWPKEQAIREAEAKADDLPRVLLKTNQGDITIELFENEAPNSVANFISLVKKGYYNGLSFHRVISGFMAQGGDPSGNGTGGPGYTIADECNQPNHRLHFRGSLSMAHSAQPDSNGSQFFLTFVPTPHLDGKHTVFGRVIDGMDVLAKLKRGNPESGDISGARDKIIEAKVLRKRDHAYEPKKVGE